MTTPLVLQRNQALPSAIFDRPSDPKTIQPGQINGIPSPTPMEFSTTPSGKHIYGTTPGGTRRIVYSREQLLMLAASPLSKTTMPVPREISRSPEQPSTASFGSTEVVQAQQLSSTPISGRHGAAATTRRTSLSFGRSPPSNLGSKSIRTGPGNAFNFAKGPISPTTANGTTTSMTPASFKERLEAAEAAAAKQQRQQDEDDKGEQPNPLGRARLGSQSSNDSHRSHGNESDGPFAMDM